MKVLKGLLRSKLLWGVIVSLFLISEVVNANKEVQKDLVAEYYASGPSADIMKVGVVDSIKLVPKLSKSDSLVEYALTLLGKGYLYGKTGPENFDCSGYIFHVFKKFKVTLPRSSRSQAKSGEPLQIKDIQKGDLLFFKSPTPGNLNIGHVGIAIENVDGEVKFIHSSTGRGVVIDSLGSKHYGKRFMEARRVL